VPREFNASFSIDFEIVYCSPLAPVPPRFWTSFGPSMCGCATKLCCLQEARRMRFVTAIVVATAVALAGCTSDGMPPSTGDSGSVGSFVRNLFRSRSEDQLPVPHNDVPAVASNEAAVGPSHPVAPSTPKTKSGTSKLKPSAVAVTPAPKQQASTEPQSPPENTTPALLSGAAPALPTGSFDNRARR
jgi:hypothetical protein